MSRSRSGFYSTIEYIGPRPQRPKKRNFFGGWVIVAITLGMGFWFGRPLIPFFNQADASVEHADAVIASLTASNRFGDRLAAAALAHAGDEVTYDNLYYKIPYPNGDVPANKGMAADVVVRAFRGMGMDLQVLVHEDMAKDFRSYPQLWNATEPDTNIDHRRVENLQEFFERNGQSLGPSKNASDFKPGDIVVWSLPNATAESHIGIIVPGPGDHAGEAWVVHNMGEGMKWENVLFHYQIQCHFRFPKQAEN